ncbi:hypothetical protein OsI_14829 [Oryza sativa Indica Group]|uniref:Uncharacterized protein n=1 Tax=Oryza sativa subsp. indica TaxID=39946 RepID=B8AV21_ORYSI|nr:hypothetical protein OsI_14829 [Oryza sativa Indica Group]
MTVTTKLLAQELTKDLQCQGKAQGSTMLHSQDSYVFHSATVMHSILEAALEMETSRQKSPITQCFFDWAFHSSVVPEDHINDSDQSSTLAGCSACCDHATTSENTEDQICISIHVAPFHSSVVPEDHINDSDQSSTIAGCSTCCDHAMTSENTEDQVDTFGLHTRIFHVLQLSITHLQGMYILNPSHNNV